VLDGHIYRVSGQKRVRQNGADRVVQERIWFFQILAAYQDRLLWCLFREETELKESQDCR